jgi:predicted nucleic acid-binding protein
MRLVVDTNILVSATVKDAGSRAVLVHPDFRFYAPEYALVELERHYPEILKKSGLSDGDCRTLIDALLSGITVVPRNEFEAELPKALRMMKDIDLDDAPFLALAMSFRNDGIWSEDRDFQKQKAVRVWRTKELLELL